MSEMIRVQDGSGVGTIGWIKENSPDDIRVYDASGTVQLGYCNANGTYDNWNQRISTNIAPYLLLQH